MTNITSENWNSNRLLQFEVLSEAFSKKTAVGQYCAHNCKKCCLQVSLERKSNHKTYGSNH